MVLWVERCGCGGGGDLSSSRGLSSTSRCKTLPWSRRLQNRSGAIDSWSRRPHASATFILCAARPPSNNYDAEHNGCRIVQLVTKYKRRATEPYFVKTESVRHARESQAPLTANDVLVAHLMRRPDLLRIETCRLAPADCWCTFIACGITSRTIRART